PPRGARATPGAVAPPDDNQVADVEAPIPADDHPRTGPEERPRDEELAPPLEHGHARARGGRRSRRRHRTDAATVRSATAKAPSARERGLFEASTSGGIPAPSRTPPPPRLRPLGVKYSPTVM